MFLRRRPLLPEKPGACSAKVWTFGTLGTPPDSRSNPVLINSKASAAAGKLMVYSKGGVYTEITLTRGGGRWTLTATDQRHTFHVRSSTKMDG
jgi:hypothetical protein